MDISTLRLMNWRNFKAVNVSLGERMFVVGPNASGKSNLLDVFRFLKDIARPDGGLQKALMERGGLSKIRNLAAPQRAQVEIEVGIADGKTNTEWAYELHLSHKKNGGLQFMISKEQVKKNGKIILDRPDTKDREDAVRLTQTSLEQVMANETFRGIADFFSSIDYMHLVPQLVRYANAFPGPGVEGDPFGKHFIKRVAETPEKTREKRLTKIEAALRIAVPQLKHLKYTKDEMGNPHMETIYQHWRPQAGSSQEDRFSDGTLRLVGFLWSLMETETLLLLEEPELSLHDTVVDKLPPLMYRLKKKKSQVFISTHSQALLADKGIGGEEILILTPGKEGTVVQVASDMRDVRILLENGMSAAEVVIPRTTPENIHQLGLIK